jgi:hypothetical protein
MKIAENKNMKVTGGEYITVADMVSALEVPTETIKKRLFYLGIKPLSRDALYPVSVLDALKNMRPKGRPKKLEAEAAKPARKPAKAKK